jgi:hypothetical protein
MAPDDALKAQPSLFDLQEIVETDVHYSGEQRKYETNRATRAKETFFEKGAFLFPNNKACMI